MFIVANTSKGIITITDLGIEIPPNQSRDLHKIPTKIPPEDSKDLKNATSSGIIKEVKRDRPPPGVSIEKTKHTHEKVIEKTRVINQGANKEEIVEALFERIKKELPLMGIEKSKEEPMSNELLMEMMKKMEKMSNSIQSGSISTGKSQTGETEDDSDYSVDPELLKQIHARAVEKLTKNTEREISYDHTEEKDKSISKGIDELEELLG